ncbi:hypothetical protein CMUS01_13216 [Colletotrichum musicola]|uniref:Uncharacterized protein n=1 Tax=Colletotrichum musicola TaxID=2175873 RepID=A0A8H6JFI3_9PEZI|nr:hypothetical protein CMUS01_13216 [Colletotrichum musicola]
MKYLALVLATMTALAAAAPTPKSDTPKNDTTKNRPDLPASWPETPWLKPPAEPAVQPDVPKTAPAKRDFDFDSGWSTVDKTGN